MEFKRVGIKSYSKCAMYRTRQLRPGTYISERNYFAGEKPKNLYSPWCFIAFAKTEREARANCRKHASSKGMIDAKQILKELGIPTS